MRERQAELDHQRVVAELQQNGSNSLNTNAEVKARTGFLAEAAAIDVHRNGASTQLPAVRPEEVINKLTERLADRIRDELRAELQQEAQAAGAASLGSQQQQQQQEAAQLEGFLAKEIQSHTCPICYELMAPPSNSPILLFPCGHTFCSGCITSHIEQHRRSVCPFCRETIQSQAPNFSLQQLIQNFMSERQRVSSEPAARSSSTSGKLHAGGALVVKEEQRVLSSAEEHARIRREHGSKAVRLRVLANELADAEAEDAAACRQAAAAATVTGHLRHERAAALDRLRAAQAEVQLADEQLQEAVEREAVLSQQREVVLARKDLVRRTLEPLVAEVEKLEVLLSGLQELQEVAHQ